MSPGLATVLLLALLPAAGNFVGGLAAEWRPPGRAARNLALHLAAGVIVAVVAVEVMPRALGTAPAGVLAGAFVAGGGAYLLLEAAVGRGQRRLGASARAGPWMVYAAVAADLVGDGLLIGAGSAVSGELALLLALGQVLADAPEGYAALATLRSAGLARRTRLALSAAFAIPALASAALAFFALRARSDAVQVSALVFVSGLYLLAAIEDMLEEAHESAEDSRWSALAFLAGFALFLLVSAGLGAGG